MIQNSACLSNNNELETQVIVIQMLPVRFVMRKDAMHTEFKTAVIKRTNNRTELVYP